MKDFKIYLSATVIFTQKYYNFRKVYLLFTILSGIIYNFYQLSKSFF